MGKNIAIKKELFWKQTIWEFITPLLFGFALSYYTRGMLSSVSDMEVAMQTSGILFIISISVITSAFSSSCSFILNQLVYDKENKMRETLRIMSLNRLAYSMSAYLTQGFFALLTSLIIYSAYAVAFRDEGENMMGN